VILLFLFVLGLSFKIENLFGAQFDELEKVYINSHKKHCTLLIRVTTFIDEHLSIYIYILYHQKYCTLKRIHIKETFVYATCHLCNKYLWVRLQW